MIYTTAFDSSYYDAMMLHNACPWNHSRCVGLVTSMKLCTRYGLWFLPSAAIGGDGYCRRSLRPAVCPSVCLSVRLERRYCSSSSRISAICLQFRRMMHSTMEKMGIWNSHARPILRVPWQFSYVTPFELSLFCQDIEVVFNISQGSTLCLLQITTSELLQLMRNMMLTYFICDNIFS